MRQEGTDVLHRVGRVLRTEGYGGCGKDRSFRPKKKEAECEVSPGHLGDSRLLLSRAAQRVQAGLGTCNILLCASMSHTEYG